MDAIILNIIRLNPAYFPFLSGICISASINIITDIAMAERVTEKHPFLLASSLLMFTSGCLFALLAWKHGPINAASFSKSDEQVLEYLGAMQSGKKRHLYLTLTSSLLIASLCGIGGIIALLLCLSPPIAVLVAP